MAERRTETKRLEVLIGEQRGTVSVPFDYEIKKPVYETLEVAPSREEQIRFVALGGAVCLLFLYFLIVIAAFGGCLWSGTEPGRSLEVQLVGTITFLTGVLCGLTPPSNPASRGATDSRILRRRPTPKPQAGAR